MYIFNKRKNELKKIRNIAKKRTIEIVQRVREKILTDGQIGAYLTKRIGCEIIDFDYRITFIDLELKFIRVKLFNVCKLATSDCDVSEYYDIAFQDL